MSLRQRAVALTVAAAALLTPLGFAGTPAHADRCQPEELVLGPGTSPVDERDNPVCVVLLQYVYPAVCRDYVTAPRCLQSIALNPGYRPPLIPAYNPNPGRIYCNLYLWVNSSGTCTYAAAGAAGAVDVVTDLGVLTLSPGQE